MKLSIKNLGLALTVLTLSSVAFGQKKNETSAAVEYKNKFLPAMMTGDVETAKKALIDAKGFIDLAVVNPETENSQKTLWLKSEIYASFLTFGMQTQDTAFIRVGGEDAMEQSIAAVEKGYPIGTKLQPDFRESVYQKSAMLNGVAGMLWQAEQFKEAAEVYDVMVRYSAAIKELDTNSLFNSSLCYERSGEYEKAAMGYEKLAAVNYKGTASAVDASRAHRKAGNSAKAKAIITDARAKNPNDKDLLLELVNTNIEEGDAAGAEKSLNDAIAADPKNKVLYYTIGTIYIDLKENEKAEASLNKALEIDPNYVDAQYQLGAHLVSWAGDIKLKANDLPFGDPSYNQMVQQSSDTYNRALIPLEKYIAANPKDKDVLNILFQLHRNLGNSEKALEYKKRAEGIE